MTTVNHDITELNRGQTVVQPFTVKNTEDELLNLTGADIWFYVKKYSSDDVHNGDDKPLLAKTLDDGITVTDARQGEFEVFISDDDWDSIPRKENPYEVWVKDVKENEAAIVKGDIIVDKRK